MSREPEVIRNAVLRLMVGFVALLSVSGWIFSWLHVIAFQGIFAAIVVAAASILWVGRARRAWPDFCEGVLKPLAFPPFLVLVLLALVAGLIYPPTMLDSLTYRLPRMWLWLQDHSILNYCSSNARLDYMPQTWGLATMPLLQAFGDKLAWFWTFCGWLALYLAVYDLSWNLNQNFKKSQYLAFFVSSSTFAVLQATSTANDLFAGTSLLLALHFIGNFERSRDWREINWAVLSFALACGTKLHYAVFGLPLVLWFILSPSRPWRIFPWKWSVPLLAVWLLCSPVPSFFLNENASGTWVGADYKRTKSPGGPAWNLVAGTTMMLWQTPQPPINPLALPFRNTLDQIGAAQAIKNKVPKFTLVVHPMLMADMAGLGLVSCVMIIAGITMARRRRLLRVKTLPGWAGLSCIVLMLVAISQYVPGGIARTYAGFLFLTFPAAVIGWNLFSEKALKWGVWLSLASGVITLVVDPSRPLWPAQTVRHELEKSPRFAHLESKVDSYFVVPERAHTGEELVAAIPQSEPQVLVLCGDDRPLLPLFRPYWLGRNVILVPAHSSPKILDELGINYIIIGGDEQHDYAEIYQYLQKETNLFHVVMTKSYDFRLTRGTEEWALYGRIGRPKPRPN